MANFKLKQSVWLLAVLVGWGLGAPAFPASALVEPGKEVVQPQPMIDLDKVGDPFAQFNAPKAMPEPETVLRNPFATPKKLIEMKTKQASKEAVATRDGMAFTPREDIKIPKMRLRGHLLGANGEVLALLQIGGSETYIVREGDTVGLNELGIDSVLRVHKISRLHMVVEAGSLNQMIIVR